MVKRSNVCICWMHGVNRLCILIGSVLLLHGQKQSQSSRKIMCLMMCMNKRWLNFQKKSLSI